MVILEEFSVHLLSTDVFFKFAKTQTQWGKILDVGNIVSTLYANPFEDALVSTYNPFLCESAMNLTLVCKFSFELTR